MKFFILLSLFVSFNVFSSTTLYLFGGGDRPKGALKDFIKTAGGEQSLIVVIPWASEDIEGGLNIQRDLSELTKAKVELLGTNPTVVQKQIAKATGIFFTGGDQNKLMRLMDEYGMRAALREKFLSGVSFAGTSAGTAIMSKKMITGEGDFTVLNGRAVEIGVGLGLLPERVIVDQHFIVRGRFNRLAGVVLGQNHLGIGVDENNALVIYDNATARVYGPTQALFFTPKGSAKLEIDVFSSKDSIDLARFPAFTK